MTEENKEPKKKFAKKKVEKPVRPEIYKDGEIIMPSSMLKDRESFWKIWKGKLKSTDINEAWKRAEKFINKYE